MRSYHVAAAAFAIGCETKWLDNLLSQVGMDGVSRERQGVARRIDADAVLRIAVARRLAHDLALPVRRALTMAEGLVAAGGRTAYPNGTQLSLDVTAIRKHVDHRLGEAAEALVTPRRGRPRLAERGARGG